MAVALEDPDDLDAGLMVGRLGPTHAVGERPHRLVGIREGASDNLVADQDFGANLERRQAFRPWQGTVRIRKLHARIGTEEHGGIGRRDRLFQLAFAPVGQAAVGLFTFADVLRALEPEPIAEGVHHRAHTVCLELVDEGLEVGFAARKDLGVDRQGIAFLDPVISAPSIGVHVDAAGFYFLRVFDQGIEVLGLFGADHQMRRVLGILLPFLGPPLRAFVSPLALDFRVWDIFLRPDAEQRLVVFRVALRNEKGEATERIVVGALPEIRPRDLDVGAFGFKLPAR